MVFPVHLHVALCLSRRPTEKVEKIAKKLNFVTTVLSRPIARETGNLYLGQSSKSLNYRKLERKMILYDAASHKKVQIWYISSFQDLKLMLQF